MNDEKDRIVARYTTPATTTLGKPSVATVLDTNDYEDRQMIKNHDRAAAAQLSTGIRLDNMQKILTGLAVSMNGSVIEFNGVVSSAQERLDKDKRTDKVAIDFGEQALTIVSDRFLKSLYAGGEFLVNQAGSDIRDGVKAEPPPMPQKETIIVQAPDNFRPSEGLRDIGREKFVRKVPGER